VTLFQALTAQVPFDEESTLAILTKHLMAPVPEARRLNPALPPEVERVLQKALAKDRSERYASGAELLKDFEKALLAPTEPVHHPPPSQIEPRPAATQRAPASRPTVSVSTTTYNVADTGPAGGVVFYDKGNTTGGWRYLEAAPELIEGYYEQWGPYPSDVPGADGTAIGTGKQNTADIIAALIPGATGHCAAQVCDRLTFGGFSDWFLPSKDELNLIYTNLYRQGLGDFSGYMYWSSSERSANSAWAQLFDDDDGYEYDEQKKYEAFVRAVRAF
jgi:serine/threonine protein kinase